MRRTGFSADEMRWYELQRSLRRKLSPSTISFHTRILLEAGLIYSEKQGVSVINTARKEEIEKRFPGSLHAVFQHHLAEVKAKNKSVSTDAKSLGIQKKTVKEIKISGAAI